jgi:hypothetical protein
MKQATVTFMKRYNLGNYEHEEYTISAGTEGKDPVETLLLLKGMVTIAKDSEAVSPEPEEVVKPTKQKGKANGKNKKEDEKEDQEEDVQEDEEVLEEEVEEAKPKKNLKKKGSTYSRESDLHKKLFVEIINEDMPDGWLKKNAGRAKTVSMKMNGMDFLDADGDVLESFKKSMIQMLKGK